MHCRKRYFIRCIQICGVLCAGILLSIQALYAQPLRIQFLRSHQAQFAGFYVANVLGMYEQEGLEVEFLEGGGRRSDGRVIDTLEVLEAGRADLAIAWMSNAIAARQAGAKIQNIAQLFRHPGTTLVCRRDAGIHKPSDIIGKNVGVWSLGDQLAVQYWFEQNGLESRGANLASQRPDGLDLIEGHVACATAMSYNEKWRFLDAGLAPTDLYNVQFATHGVAFLEDGLYARSSSLADPLERTRIVRFLRATIKGWHFAREHPEEALSAVLRRMSQPERDHQRRMLESVIFLAEPTNNFGLLDLAAFERSLGIIAMETPISMADAGDVWTHSIWREAMAGERGSTALSPATIYYANILASSPSFMVILYFGVFFYILYGVLEASRHGFTIWGQMVIGFVCALGGGMLRDVIIAGDRLPFGFVKDATALIGIVVVTIVTAALLRLFPGFFSGETYRRMERTSESIGFGTLTVYGAIVALKSGMPWYWLPLCAAITCSGGGLMMSIIMGVKSNQFRGAIYEEVAILGALVFVAGLFIQDALEHSPWILGVSALLAGVGSGLLRYWIDTRGIRYSSWLVGQPRPA